LGGPELLESESFRNGLRGRERLKKKKLKNANPCRGGKERCPNPELNHTGGDCVCAEALSPNTTRTGAALLKKKGNWNSKKTSRVWNTGKKRGRRPGKKHGGIGDRSGITCLMVATGTNQKVIPIKSLYKRETPLEKRRPRRKRSRFFSWEKKCS